MKHTILIVDDVKINLDFLKMILIDKYNILSATNGKEAIALAKSENIDLILLDIIMPEMNGYEVCEILKNNPKTKNIPIIFVTSQIDEQSIVKGYESGAVDYVTKPYKRMELISKIKTHLKLKSLIEELEYIATHDTMTDIYNRRQFFKLSEKKFTQQKENLVVVMIDIDDFKKINDNYGHHIGDRVIKEFTKTIKNYISKDTIFGRIGGEEFALICNFEKESRIQKKVDILRKAIERTSIETPYGKIKFTISLGVAKITNKHKNIDEALKEADDNLYIAKNEGKNKVIFRQR